MLTTMEQLERSLRPNAVVQVTVPSVDGTHRPLSSRRAKAMVFAMILEISPGATALSGEGIWRNGAARPVREPVSIVFTHLPNRVGPGARRRFLQKLRAFIRWAKQDAVLVVVNNRPFFVKGVTGGRRVVSRREVA